MDLPEIDNLWNYQKPDESKLKFEAALKDLEEKNEPNCLSFQIELMSQIARCHSLQLEIVEAHRQLDKAEELWKEGGDTKSKVRILLERGRSFNSNREQSLAIPIFQEAFELAKEQLLDFFSVDAAHMLGIATPPKEGLEWNLKAIAIAKSSDDPKARKWMGSLLNNSGWMLFDMKRYEEAYDIFEEGLKFQLEHKKDRESKIARWSMAKMKRFLGDIETALQWQETLLEENNGVDESGYTYEELGECCLALDEKEEAAAWFEKAYEKLSADPWLQKNEKDRLDRILKLSQPS